LHRIDIGQAGCDEGVTRFVIGDTVGEGPKGSATKLESFRLLEHVPEKLTDFSDQNMLQEIDFERIPIGIRSSAEALAPDS
jgi:hypothetical protein